MRSTLAISLLLLCLAALGVAQPPFGPPPFGGPPGGRPGRPGMGPRGPGGPPMLAKPTDISPTPKRPGVENEKSEDNLIANHELENATKDGKAPERFMLTGDVAYGYLGTPSQELAGWGVRLLSGKDADKDGNRAGSVSCLVSGLRAKQQRWYRFRIRGLAQPGFRVANLDLFLKAEFFANSGTNALDSITKKLYGAIENDRKTLTTGNAKPADAAVWRTYAIEFRLPFAEIDSLRLSVGFDQGTGNGLLSEFWIDEVELEPIAEPAEIAEFIKSRTGVKSAAPDQASLVPLGGRWYYDPRGGSRTPPTQFDHTNADRLHYLSARLETPFADNMAAWLRPGWLDRSGQRVTEDRFVPDNVIVSFTAEHMIVRSHNLPNHPTAVFPDWSRSLDGNPNSIQEQDHTWYIPLEPKESPSHVSMTAGNANRALNGGPIGIAVNGVVFFNPFDADVVEALWRLDRCCGHPGPGYEYHYHKYPVCVKTPWFDDAQEHSPLIGFALDGFPVYGPYESAGLMAKDSKDNRLDAFNGHSDPERGWHYHVSPGKFPYIIGGYWGAVDPKNRRGPPGGMRGMR